MEPQNTLNTRKNFLFEEESYLLRGAALFEVYREMEGVAFLEAGLSGMLGRKNSIDKAYSVCVST